MPPKRGIHAVITSSARDHIIVVPVRATPRQRDDLDSVV